MTENELHWLAGFLEGEGCFSWVRPSQSNRRKHGAPMITATSTDEDIIRRVASMLCTTVLRQEPRAEKYKAVYSTRAYSAAAAGYMMELYPLMGLRRQQKIREILQLHQTQFTERRLEPHPVPAAVVQPSTIS